MAGIFPFSNFVDYFVGSALSKSQCAIDLSDKVIGKEACKTAWR